MRRVPIEVLGRSYLMAVAREPNVKFSAVRDGATKLGYFYLPFDPVLKSGRVERGIGLC